MVEALRQTAAESQHHFASCSRDRGATYRSTYIANETPVRAGSRALLDEITVRPEVARVTASHEVRPPDLEWGLAREVEARAIEPNLFFVGADDAWILDVAGAGVVVGVNDAGVDEDHPAIAAHCRGCLNPPT